MQELCTRISSAPGDMTVPTGSPRPQARVCVFACEHTFRSFCLCILWCYMHWLGLTAQFDSLQIQAEEQRQACSHLSAFFVSASSVFCLTGSLLCCWLCDISEGGFLLCLIHLSVLPSVWQVLNYCGEHKGPHPTHLIYLHRSTLAGWVQRKHFICVKQDISPSQKLLHCSLIFPPYLYNNAAFFK